MLTKDGTRAPETMETMAADKLLLFSDIEGSTVILQQIGDLYAQVLLRHNEILRQEITAQGGEVISTEGDSFFATFDTAGSGLRAAVSVQRLMANEAWPVDLKLRVRMGLHFGRTRKVGGELVGLDVHRAARVCAAASGGQILLTSEVMESLSDSDLDDLGVKSRKLGRHRLKDLRYPETLLDIDDPVIALEFPPPQSLERRITNLPSSAPEVFGRGREMEELEHLLNTHAGRLVTVFGPGGMGKTTLAETVARRMMDAFEDGVFVVRFDSTMDPDLTFPAIIAALGLRDFPNRTPQEDLEAAIGVGRFLLILDTFEHLLPAAPSLAAVLEACPNLRILVTSQVELGLSCEKVLPLSPLELSRNGAGQVGAAVEMFVSKVREIDPDFELDDDNRETVLEIVDRLEGIPLALEIAASQLRILGPEQLLGRLDDRARSMRSRTRDVARQHSLEAAISWSDQLLSEEERDVFHRLSVFAGGFGIEDAEQVLDPLLPVSTDVLDTVAALYSKSLLKRSKVNGEPRFAMYDVVRSYANERLETSGTLVDMQLRHLEYYREAATVNGAMAMHRKQRRHVLWLDRQTENLRVAMRTAIDGGRSEDAGALIEALYWYWITRGRFTEGLRWVDRASAKFGSDARDAGAARMNLAAAYLKAMAGDYAAAYTHGAAAEEAFAALEDPLNEARARLIHAVGAVASEKIEDPTEMIESALAVLTDRNDSFFNALGLTIMGELCRLGGMREAAEELYVTAEQLFAGLENSFWLAAVRLNIGHIRLSNEDIAAAREKFSMAIAICEQNDYRALHANAVAGLAGLASRCGAPENCLLILEGVRLRMAGIGADFEPTDQAEIDGYLAHATAAVSSEVAEEEREKATHLSWSEIAEIAIGYAAEG